MTLETYLRRRKRYEIAFGAGIALLIGLVMATSKIIEHVREGYPSHWQEAFATEFTAAFSVLLLIPPLVWFLQTLKLNWSNMRWRILWHIPAFLCFSLAHVALFVGFRELLWRGFGENYEFGPVALGLVYEMRKGLVLYLALVILLQGYQFILDRLQGEAGFIDNESGDRSEWIEQFLVSMLNRQFLVKTESIEWMQSAGNYVILHTGTRDYPMRQTLTSLEQQLNPAQFLRVHRTAIINMTHVRALQTGAETRVELNSGDTVPVSKTYLPALKAVLTTPFPV